MAWIDDWRTWSQISYAVIHSIDTCDRLDGGNSARIQQSIASSVAWSPGNLGFVPSAPPRAMRPDSIRIDDASVRPMLDLTKRKAAELLLINTVVVFEVLLADILRGKVALRNEKLSALLITLKNLLQSPNRRAIWAKVSWSIDAAHELRVLRNVLVHASGRWSQQAIDDLRRSRPGLALPAAGSAAQVNTGILLAFRRAARTALDAADRV